MAMTYVANQVNPKAFLDVLAFNEEHFVFDKRMAFVTIELLVLPYEETPVLKTLLCCEIATEARHRINKLIDRNAYYPIIKPFFTDKSLDVIEREGVFVFNRTFLKGENLPTNRMYEDPQRSIRVDGDDKITIYKIPAIVPSVARIDVEYGQNQDFSVINITTTKPMQPKTVYAFRLGFWTWYDKKYDNSLLSGFGYHVRACACFHEDRARKDGPSSGQCQDCNCRFWVKTSSTHGLSKLLEELKTANGLLSPDKKEELARHLTSPHSDIWVVIPKYWRVRQAGRFAIPIEHSKSPSYLLYSQTLDPVKRDQFLENGLKLASLEGVRDPYIDPCEKKITRNLSMSIDPYFKIVRYSVGHLIRYLSIPAIYLAINIHEYLKSPVQSIIYATTFYLGALFLDLILAHRDFLSYLFGNLEKNWLFRKFFRSAKGSRFAWIFASIAVCATFIALVWFTFAKDPNADMVVRITHLPFAFMECVGVLAGMKIALSKIYP